MSGIRAYFSGPVQLLQLSDFSDMHAFSRVPTTPAEKHRPQRRQICEGVIPLSGDEPRLHYTLVLGSLFHFERCMVWHFAYSRPSGCLDGRHGRSGRCDGCVIWPASHTVRHFFLAAIDIVHDDLKGAKLPVESTSSHFLILSFPHPILSRLNHCPAAYACVCVDACRPACVWLFCLRRCAPLCVRLLCKLLSRTFCQRLCTG